MSDHGEHLILVAYDIADPKRWRQVFRIVQGYGDWLQLSVFQCRLSRRRQAELRQALSAEMNHAHDHIVFIDLGPADSARPKVDSLGKPFKPVTRSAVIV